LATPPTSALTVMHKRSIPEALQPAWLFLTFEPRCLSSLSKQVSHLFRRSTFGQSRKENSLRGQS